MAKSDAPAVDPAEYSDDGSSSSSSSSSFDIDRQRFLEQVANARVEDLVEPKKHTINHTDKLLAKAKEVALPEHWPWIETLDVTGAEPTALADVENDYERELLFYNQALAAALQARAYFAEHDIPANRPHDYFAEMVKTDTHMEKVRRHHIVQDLKIAAVEQRKKEKMMKKFGKHVEAEKLQARAKSKREQADIVKAWRKRRANALDDDGFDLSIMETGADLGQPARKKPKFDDKGRPVANAKRLAKNKKFGMGGKKKHAKSNTKASYDDFVTDFRPSVNAPSGPSRLSRGARKKARGTKSKSKRRRKR